jgi:hypothetical protein
MTGSEKRFVALTSVWILSFCPVSLGWSSTSSVSGTVLDPQRRWAFWSLVSLDQCDEKIFLRSPKSNLRGNVLRAVSPAMHRIQVDAPDFKKLRIEEVWAWWRLAHCGPELEVGRCPVRRPIARVTPDGYVTGSRADQANVPVGWGALGVNRRAKPCSQTQTSPRRRDAGIQKVSRLCTRLLR